MATYESFMQIQRYTIHKTNDVNKTKQIQKHETLKKAEIRL